MTCMSWVVAQAVVKIHMNREIQNPIRQLAEEPPNFGVRDSGFGIRLTPNPQSLKPIFSIRNPQSAIRIFMLSPESCKRALHSKVIPYHRRALKTLLGNGEVVSPVFGPSLFVVTWIKGLLFAVAHGGELLFLNPEFAKILLAAVGSSLSQGHIVFVGTSLVAITLNTHLSVWIVSHPSGILLKNGLCCIS